MIKVANNLTAMCLVKFAEEDEIEQAEKKKRKRQAEEDVPTEDRKVDYGGRARRGALYGAIPGALLGGAVGLGIGGASIDEGDLKPGTGEYTYDSVTNKPTYIDAVYEGGDSGKMMALKLLLGGGIGALGGGLLGGGVGALGNMLQGYRDEDVITRRAEPNRLRRAILGGIPGAVVGGLYGGAIGHGSNFTGAGRDASALAGLGLGALGGGALGALGGGVIEPWLNKDRYDQNYMQG